MSACPACDQVNSHSANTCLACGSPLLARCPACHTINARSRERCHQCAALLARPAEPVEPDIVPAVLLMSAPAEKVNAPAPGEARPAEGARESAPSAAPPLPSTPAPLLTLRLGELPDLPDLPAAPARRTSPKLAPPDFPPIVFDEIKLPELPPPVLSHAEQKAARRASVRRAQQRHQRRTLTDPGVRPEVLLLEPNGEVRAQLADVLKAFGFRARLVASVTEANALADGLHFVATFIGLAPQDSLASGLCTRLRATPRPSMRPLAVVAMVDRDRHADRVRMELAGADEVLFRPVHRGDVARALENCGLRLPHDPRAATKP